ncbi:MAG TPA: cell envelope integrity protein TolA [Jiangellaceae bacterium]
MASTLMDATSVTHDTWFDLFRHDEDATSEESGATDTAETEEAAAEDPTKVETDGDKADEGLGEAGKRALAETRAERNKAKKEASDLRKALAEERKQLAEKAKRLAEFEDKDKSETEKLVQRAEQAQKKAEEAEARVQAALARAVKAEVKAFAAGQFADPEDASAFLNLADYAGEDGEVDVESIKADLESLLERKPHLRKAAPATEEQPKKPKPKPDPSQGSRKEPGPLDFRTADKATLDAELQKLGVRPSW